MLRNSLIVFTLLPLLVGAQCGPGATYDSDRNKCFQYYKAAVDYDTAEAICASSSGHLISVHNAIDNTYFAKQAQLNIYSDGPVWLGAQALSTVVTNPANWHWTDGTQFDYQNYRSGQPTTIGSSACMQFLAGSSKWLTASCTNIFPFICAYPPTSSPVTTCAPQKPNRCPSRYTWFDLTDHCYKMKVKDTNFTEANAACQFEGAQLASVHSKNENDFLVELSKTGLNVSDVNHIHDVWIGLFYKNGAWQWTDSTAVDYLNWAQGEPNRMDTEWWTTILPDPYTSYYDPNGGQWNNVGTVTQRGYICKRPTN